MVAYGGEMGIYRTPIIFNDIKNVGVYRSIYTNIFSSIAVLLPSTTIYLYVVNDMDRQMLSML